jgi:hypothetical protein
MVTGNEIVKIKMTVDQVTFVIAGLRGLASDLVDSYVRIDPEEIMELSKIVDENRAIADLMERAYVDQLP